MLRVSWLFPFYVVQYYISYSLATWYHPCFDRLVKLLLSEL